MWEHALRWRVGRQPGRIRRRKARSPLLQVVYPQLGCFRSGFYLHKLLGGPEFHPLGSTRPANGTCWRCAAPSGWRPTRRKAPVSWLQPCRSERRWEPVFVLCTSAVTRCCNAKTSFVSEVRCTEELCVHVRCYLDSDQQNVVHTFKYTRLYNICTTSKFPPKNVSQRMTKRRVVFCPMYQQDTP